MTTSTMTKCETTAETTERVVGIKELRDAEWKLQERFRASGITITAEHVPTGIVQAQVSWCAMGSQPVEVARRFSRELAMAIMLADQFEFNGCRVDYAAWE